MDLSVQIPEEYKEQLLKRWGIDHIETHCEKGNTPKRGKIEIECELCNEHNGACCQGCPFDKFSGPKMTDTVGCMVWMDLICTEHNFYIHSVPIMTTIANIWWDSEHHDVVVEWMEAFQKAALTHIEWI